MSSKPNASYDELVAQRDGLQRDVQRERTMRRLVDEALAAAIRERDRAVVEATQLREELAEYRRISEMRVRALREELREQRARADRLEARYVRGEAGKSVEDGQTVDQQTAAAYRRATHGSGDSAK